MPCAPVGWGRCMPVSELRLRVISAAGLVVAAGAYLFYTPRPTFVLIAAALGLIATREYAQAGARKGLPLRPTALYLHHFLAFGAGWFYQEGNLNLFYLLSGFLLSTLLSSPWIVRGGYKEGLLWQTLPLLWITFPFYILTVLRFNRLDGEWILLFIILTAAINDSTAYFGGKRFGRHKLAPAISPNKTIEGSLFGYLGGLLFGLGFGGWYLKLMPWPLLVGLILLLVFAAQAGDLFESKFKRFCGIKDSGNILPGHGGILDRFDAYLTCLPLYWLLTLSGS